MADDVPDQQGDFALRELFHHPDQVPLVYWREFSGAKTTVLLTGVVAVLAFVTGLSHLSQQTVSLGGPLAAFVPGTTGVLRFFGVFFAFVLAGLVVGLRRRVRVAWYGTVAGLGLLSLLPLTTAQATDVPLFLAILVTLPLLVRNRGQFDQRLDLSPFQIAALATFLAVQLYGTLGAYVLRDQYTGIETWTDALYYMVVTGTTVGYGDATPVTGEAKLFTLSVLVVGTAAFGAAFGSLLVPALESRVTAAFGTMTASELTLLEDHVLVLGDGELTEPLLDELAPTTDVVVVTPDTDATSTLRDRDVSVLTADPTDSESLLDASVGEASGVVAAADDDAQNVLAILATRQVNPDVRVVAAATDRRHVAKLREVGADEVVSPAVIGGRMLGRSVLGDTGPLFEDANAGGDEGEDDH